MVKAMVSSCGLKLNIKVEPTLNSKPSLLVMPCMFADEFADEGHRIS